MSVSTNLYYLRWGQIVEVRSARWREHDTMRGGNDGSRLAFGGEGELLEHQFEGGTDRMRLADLLSASLEHGLGGLRAAPRRPPRRRRNSSK